MITLDLKTQAQSPNEERIQRVRFAQAFCVACFLLLLWPYYRGVSALHPHPTFALRMHEARIFFAGFLAMIGFVLFGLFLQVWEVRLKRTNVPPAPVRNPSLRRFVVAPILALAFLLLAAVFLGQNLFEYLWPGSKSNWVEPVIVLSYAFGPFFKDLSRRVRLPRFVASRAENDVPPSINALALFTIILACGIALMFGIHYVVSDLSSASATSIQLICAIPVFLSVVVSWALLIPLDRIFDWP